MKNESKGKKYKTKSDPVKSGLFERKIGSLEKETRTGLQK